MPFDFPVAYSLFSPPGFSARCTWYSRLTFRYFLTISPVLVIVCFEVIKYYLDNHGVVESPHGCMCGYYGDAKHDCTGSAVKHPMQLYLIPPKSTAMSKWPRAICSHSFRLMKKAEYLKSPAQSMIFEACNNILRRAYLRSRSVPQPRPAVRVISTHKTN